MWPHRCQPIRLPHPWDSPGKNIGVGCHFLLQCIKVKSESEVAQSCPTLSDPMDCSLPGSSVHGIFQARVLEWGAIAFSDLPATYIKSNIFICLIFFTSNWSVQILICVLLYDAILQIVSFLFKKINFRNLLPNYNSWIVILAGWLIKVHCLSWTWFWWNKVLSIKFIWFKTNQTFHLNM